MANIADTLREELSTLPDECFEVPTFGDLKVGEKFICFPGPGDNSGHGGYMRGSYVFEKIEPIETQFKGHYKNAKRLMDGSITSDPDSMRVYKVL